MARPERDLAANVGLARVDDTSRAQIESRFNAPCVGHRFRALDECMADDSQSKERLYAMADYFSAGADELLGYTPHCEYIGIESVEVGPCFATLRLPYKAELIGDPTRGVVFGGVITTLIDHTAGLSVFCSLEEMRAIATLDLRIDYLRAAEPGVDLIGHAECYKMTTNVAFVRAIAYERDRDDPFASCLATFMLGAHEAGAGIAKAVDEGPVQ